MKAGDSTQKTVLITGATDGLGKALALLLAKRGYRVFAAGRSSEKLAQIDAVARAKKVLLESVALDVCSDDSVRSGVNHVLAKAGAIDVLVNNAGVNYTAAVEDLSMEAWRAQFETNFFGVLRVTRAVLPQMRERHVMARVHHQVRRAAQKLCGELVFEIALHGLDLPLQARPRRLLCPHQLFAKVGQLGAAAALKAHQRPAHRFFPFPERAPDVAVGETQGLGSFGQGPGGLNGLKQAKQQRIRQIGFGCSDMPTRLDLDLDHVQISNGRGDWKKI